jgi:hypothetical protein
MVDTSHPHAGPASGHEEDRVNVRSLWISAAVLAAACVLSGLVVLWLFRVIDRRLVEGEPAFTPLAATAGEASATEPRLLTDEPANLATFRAREAEKVEHYGWVDASGGHVRIPVERAKDLILERGLPARTP